MTRRSPSARSRCRNRAPIAAAGVLDTLGDGDIFRGDRADDADWLRDTVAERGAWATLRPLAHRQEPKIFSARVYRRRNRVERLFHEIKHFRGASTRYDKRDDNDLAGVQRASIRIWLRSYESAT